MKYLFNTYTPDNIPEFFEISSLNNVNQFINQKPNK
jgi:hypothetical protein